MFCMKLIYCPWNASKKYPDSRGSYTSTPGQNHLNKCSNPGAKGFMEVSGLSAKKRDRKKLKMDMLVSKTEECHNDALYFTQKLGKQ